MIRVGITGGIGSGKSVVSKIFEQLGISVFYADEESKKILDTNVVKEKLIALFGDSILDKNKNISRAQLALLVFEDKKKLEQLNAILHPAVANTFKEWSEQHEQNKYIIKEAAILFESGTNKGLDKIIHVEAPAELRLQRVIKRDNVSREKVIVRMNNQWSDEEKNKLSDFIIINDETAPVLPQVLKIHKQLIAIS